MLAPFPSLEMIENRRFLAEDRGPRCESSLSLPQTQDG
jgi:hypothetical protein